MTLFGKDYIEKMLRGVVEQDPALFYWHVDTKQICYMLPEDKNEWKQELKSLKYQCKGARGLTIIPENNKAFEFEGKKYHALVLQRKNEEDEVNSPLPILGFGHLVSGIPYYFKSETTRDKVYKYLMDGKEVRM